MITNRALQQLILDGQTFSQDRIKAFLDEESEHLEPYEQTFWSFLSEWFDEKESVMVTTSGSTGVPKQLKVSKKAMTESAIRSCKALGLSQGDSALICMNMKYIGAKMMVVRALILGMNLHLLPPSRDPFERCSYDEHYDFVSMVPLQATTALSNPKSTKILSRSKVVLLGGSAIDSSLAKQIEALPCTVFSSYGMTETLSHIALQQLNGPNASEYYHTVEGVIIDQDKRGCLIIKAPHISSSPIVTNDVVEIVKDGCFKVLGRIDNVINSGGIKIHAEEVEKALENILKCDYAVCGIKHHLWGEEVVLFVTEECDHKQIASTLSSLLSPYHVPKQIIRVKYIPLNDNGKINRNDLKHCFLGNENI